MASFLMENPILGRNVEGFNSHSSLLMIENFGPVILIELVLVFGGVLLFAWWQFRDLRKEREKNQKQKEKAPD